MSERESSVSATDRERPCVWCGGSGKAEELGISGSIGWVPCAFCDERDSAEAAWDAHVAEQEAMAWAQYDAGQAARMVTS